MRTALVVGATGAIGKALVYQLIEDGNYGKVIVLTRKPLTIKHHKLAVVLVDFDKLVDYSQQMAADDIFCCLGTTIKDAGTKETFYKIDHDYVLETAQICQRNGAHQFILVSAMGANPKSAIFYNKVKGEVERDLGFLNFKTLIVVRPSLLLTKRVAFRFGEWVGQVIMKYTGFLFFGPLKKAKAIPVETVAKAMRHYAALDLNGTHIYTNEKLFL